MLATIFQVSQDNPLGGRLELLLRFGQVEGGILPFLRGSQGFAAALQCGIPAGGGMASLERIFIGSLGRGYSLPT